MKNIVFLIIISLFNCKAKEQEYKQVVTLMGSRFDITVVANSPEIAEKHIQEAIDEILRIEQLISSWDKNSQTSKIIKYAGVKPVKVDKELFDLIERSIQISRLTHGAFDISYASMDRIWAFDGTMKEMPTEEQILKSVKKVGYHNIELNKKETTVFLKHKGMKIGFGAIGKGYAADKAKQLLQSKGVIAGIINASGDMNTWGDRADGTPWKVGIKNPKNKDKIFAYLPISNSSVVTSGNYEKFVNFKGTRYTHIINPKTGYPSSGIISVSVFAKKAELADALATAIFVMGIEVGLDFINQLSKVECIIISDIGKIYTSNNIEFNTIQNK